MNESYSLINWNLPSNEASVNSDLNLNFLLFAYLLSVTNQQYHTRVYKRLMKIHWEIKRNQYIPLLQTYFPEFQKIQLLQ